MCLILGIYVFETDEFLSIDGETTLPNQPLSTLPTESHLPDVWLYEAKQFLKLLAKGMFEPLAFKRVLSYETLNYS